MSDHRYFVIHFTYYRVTGEWLAQDDFRSSGHASEPTKEMYTIIAPSEAVAVAYFKGNSGFTDGHKMEIQKVDSATIDACLMRISL